jgi:hypothetical protein
MDEAFVPLSILMRDLGSLPADLIDDDNGVHTYVTRYEIACPVELDVGVNEHGHVYIGTTPPLYVVDTSVRPSYHRMRFVAERDGVVDDR